MFDRLCPGLLQCCGYEFNVNESAVYIKYGVLKQEHAQSKVICRSADQNVATRGWQKPNCVFLLGA